MIAPAQSLVIVGSGLAAWTVVRELRKLDAHCPITLICRDSGDFYSKPMLSNALASGKTAAQLVGTPCAAMAQTLQVNVMANTEVTSIDPSSATVHTLAGVVAYSRLVLALGADPATILGVTGGTLTPGVPADISILAPDLSVTIDAQKLVSNAEEARERIVEHTDAERDRGRTAGSDQRDSGPAQNDEVHQQRRAHEADQQLGTSHRSSSGSIPMVSPGRLAISRTASRTPGTKEVRSRLSWRIVSVSPSVPNSTS